MAVQSLSIEQVKDLFLYVSQQMIESKEILTNADRAIGDGDHGIGMARGFEAILPKVSSSNFSSIDEIFQTVGLTLLSTIGGAAGAIFGSFFIGASKGLKDCVALDSNALANCMQAGLEMVKIRGKAKVGDKTMIDALEPATMTALANTKSDLDDLLPLIAGAAENGKEKTKELIATTGKAKTLGERSIGHPDPGALSMSLILRFMSDYVESIA
jgi:dihydroxyacetone kinase-like protein